MITPEHSPVDRPRVGGEAEPARDADVFFHFTAIPGSGYRTVEPGRHVRFDRSDTPLGPVASRVVVAEPADVDGSDDERRGR